MSKTTINNPSGHSEISIAGFNALLDAAVDGIIITDSHGNIQTMNSAAQSLFGYSANEVKDKNVKMLMPQPHQEEHDGHVEQYRNTGNAKIIGIGRRVHAVKKDASVFPINLSVGEYEEGDHRYYIGVIHDLTEQISTERLAHEFRDRLAHVDRISTMGEMASGIAHELNQPLAAIGSYVQACRRRINQGAPDMDKISEILEKVEEQTLRAGKLIDRVRSLVRTQDVVRDKVFIDNVVMDAIELARADATGKGVSLETKLLDHPFVVDVDTVQIQQVVLNLIRNAVDATEELKKNPGVITIGTTLSRDQKYIEIQIRDWGAGISKEVKKRLFHPFVSSKSKGTGLGLSISQSIVEAHGGLIWADDMDPGTTFQFSIPLVTLNGT